MYLKNLSLITSIVAVSLLLSASPAYALLVGFGEYAGTHTVVFDPEPRSPFVGETVQMTFYIRNFSGDFTEEPFNVNAVIQKVEPHNTNGDDIETTLFVTKYKTVANGIYETSYTFTQSGTYRVVFNFGIPGNTDIIRDAVFGVEVRDRPQGTPNSFWIAAFSPIVILAFMGGFMLGRYRSKKRAHKIISPKN